MAQNHVLKWPLGKWSPKDPAVCPGSLILSHTHIGNMKIGEFMETRIKPWLFHRVSQTHVNQLLCSASLHFGGSKLSLRKLGREPFNSLRGQAMGLAVTSQGNCQHKKNCQVLAAAPNSRLFFGRYGRV